MDISVLDYAPPEDDQRRRVIGWLEAVVLAAAGILLPMMCFAASLVRFPGGPVYQRGYWFDCLTLVPSVMASWPFAPLMFAATFAMAVAVIAPRRVAQSWLLRGALYSGAILAAQYTLIQAIAIAEPGALVSVGTVMAAGAVGIVTALALGGLWIVPRLPSVKLVYWLPCAIVMPIAAVAAWRITLPAIVISVILCAAVAPALTLAVYLRVSFIVWKLAKQDGRKSGRIGLRVPAVWLSAYAAAWVLAFMNAIELYNSLPKTPPDC